jgi:hypothetical protein
MSDINYLTRYLNPKKHERNQASRVEYYFVRIDRDYIEADQNPLSDKVTKVLRDGFATEYFGPFEEVQSNQELYVDFSGDGIKYYFKRVIDDTAMYVTLEDVLDGFNSTSDYEIYDDQNFIFVQQNEALVHHKLQKRLYALHQKLKDIVVVAKRTLSYNYKDLGGLRNGRHELDFRDATGYTNGFWDQALDNLFKGGLITAALPSRKRSIRLKLNQKKGELYWYPRYDFTDRNNIVLFYDYHYRQSRENLDVDLSDEEYAIRLEFKHYESFLAFMNLTYFNNGVSPFSIHDDIGYRKLGLFENYVWLANYMLQKEKISLNTKLTYIYYIPPVFFIEKQKLFKDLDDPNNILGKDFLWKVLASALEERVNNVGVNTEDIVIKILYTLKSIQDYVEGNQELKKKEITSRYDYLLTKLLNSKTSTGQSFLNALYSKLNTDDFVTYNKFIYSIWAYSSYISPTHPAYAKTSQLLKEGEEPTKNTPELMLPYKTSKLLGFYSSNMDIEFKGENIVVTPDESSIDNILRYSTQAFLPPLISDLVGSGLSELAEGLLEEDWSYEYHPLQPVFLVDPHKAKAISLQSLAPMLLLKANEDKSFWSNVETTAEYAFDIITTFSGIGNLAKFRRIARIVDKAIDLNKGAKTYKKYRLLKGIKGVAAGVEITSGTVNILLKATGIEDTAFARALGEYLFWIEIIATIGEGIPAAIRGIQKAAKNMLKNPNLIIKIEKKALKEISEVAFKKLEQGAKEALSVLKELLEQAGVFIRQSWEKVSGISKKMADDLEEIGAELYKVTDQESQALKKFIVGGEEAADLVDISDVKFDYIATQDGKPIFYGSKNQFQTFTDNLKRRYRIGGKQNVSRHLGGGNYGDSIIATSDKLKVKQFARGLERLRELNITAENALDHLEEAMPYFNHEIIDGVVVQIDNLNCGNTIEVINEFLKSGKIIKAEPSGYQGLKEVSKKFGGGHFIPAKIPRMKDLMKEGEKVVVYGIKQIIPMRGLRGITEESTKGHFFYGLKKNGELHFYDGQTGEFVKFDPRSTKYGNFVDRGYQRFSYLTIRN